jgi:hypothetical protein
MTEEKSKSALLEKSLMVTPKLLSKKCLNPPLS